MRLASNETKHKSNKGLVPLVTLSVRKGSSVAYGICDDIGRSGTKPGGGSNPYSNPRGCYSNPQGSYLNPRRRVRAEQPRAEQPSSAAATSEHVSAPAAAAIAAAAVLTAAAATAVAAAACDQPTSRQADHPTD